MSKVTKFAIASLLLAIGSTVAAMAFVRIPALWPLVPVRIIDGLAKVFSVSSQESLADVEFMSAWALSFAFLAACVCFAGMFRKRKR